MEDIQINKILQMLEHNKDRYVWNWVKLQIIKHPKNIENVTTVIYNNKNAYQ